MNCDAKYKIEYVNTGTLCQIKVNHNICLIMTSYHIFFLIRLTEFIAIVDVRVFLAIT